MAVEHLRRRSVRNLAGITLLSDGTTMYECPSPEEVIDLLQGGQGVLGIDVSFATLEISGSVRHFPLERPEIDYIVNPSVLGARITRATALPAASTNEPRRLTEAEYSNAGDLRGQRPSGAVLTSEWSIWTR